MQKVTLGALRSINLSAFEGSDAAVAVERTLRLHNGAPDRDTVVVGREIVAMIPVKGVVAPVAAVGDEVGLVGDEGVDGTDGAIGVDPASEAGEPELAE